MPRWSPTTGTEGRFRKWHRPPFHGGFLLVFYKSQPSTPLKQMTAITATVTKRKGSPPVHAKIKSLQFNRIELQAVLAGLKRSKKPEISDEAFAELIRRVSQALEFAID